MDIKKLNEQYWLNRRVILASMHQKETAVETALSLVGLTLVVAKNIDTDSLGTFSGEKERELNPYETALAKIAMAKVYYPNDDLFLASEGSFEPHYAVPMLTVNTELLVLKDEKHNHIITGNEVTIETHFYKGAIDNEITLQAFAEKSNFPDYGIILKVETSEGLLKAVWKNATDFTQLLEQFEEAKQVGNTIFAETDLRAFKNPTRMQQIGKAALKLVSNMQSFCPQCQSPGFAVVRTQKGLPCEFCGLPTESVKALVKKCHNCGFEEVHQRTDGKLTEDPMYCGNCNP
ncbi:MAG: DUF6671 family protein [Chitinophagaceae bacterium]